jgi:hypothetical protein
MMGEETMLRFCQPELYLMKSNLRQNFERGKIIKPLAKLSMEFSMRRRFHAGLR